jgi:hypothetical protein
MSIKIVTDSTCDLPQSVIEELGITVVPLFINLFDKCNGFIAVESVIPHYGIDSISKWSC